MYRRKNEDGGVSGLKESLKPLMNAQVAALGQERELVIPDASVGLMPGDRIFLCTDGLLECRNAEGKRIRKMELLKNLVALAESYDDAGRICDESVKGALSFFGGSSKNLSDDVTVVVGVVPTNASFVN